MKRLNFIGVGILAGLLVAPVGWAQNKPQLEMQDPARTYAPSAVPDRIILTWSHDPTTTQSVTWRTDPSVEIGWVEWAVAGDNRSFTAKVNRRQATATIMKTNLGTAKYHSTVMESLKPKTKYAYRVGDGANWSEWSHFQTASQEPQPFSFIYFGDAQNDIKSLWSRVIREAFKDSPRAAFLLHCGDLIDQPDNDRDWAEWFAGAGWIHRTMPSIAAAGNHEHAGGKLTPHWRASFSFPEHGPQDLKESVYYVDYQGARIIVLNSSQNLDAQVKWFDQIMKENRSRWTLVAMHHPVFSTAKDRDNKTLRETLKPLFDRHQIDLVLQGHDHTYGRTGLVEHSHLYELPKKEKQAESSQAQDASGKRTQVNAKPSHRHRHEASGKTVTNIPTGLMTRSAESGTVYVVSVSGPKQYSTQDHPVFRKLGSNKQLYQIISIDGERLTFSAYTATGKLFDRFALIKREGQQNRLVELDMSGKPSR